MAINDNEKIKKRKKKKRNEEFEVEKPHRVRCRREEIVVTNTEFTAHAQQVKRYRQQQSLFYNLNFKAIALDGAQRILLRTPSITAQSQMGPPALFRTMLPFSCE